VALQDERFTVGSSQFYGQPGSAVIISGYVNYAGVPTVCAEGEEFRTDLLTLSKVCVEKSVVAESQSSNLTIILVVLLVFVLLLVAFAARFRHRIYVLLVPHAADAGVMDWKNAPVPEAPKMIAPVAAPVVDTQQAHVLYKLKFNK
jgi:hypothetical protein